MITVLQARPAEFDQRVHRLTQGQLTRADQCVTDEDIAHCSQKKQLVDVRRCVAGRAALRLVAAYRSGTPMPAAMRVVIRRLCHRCGADHGQPRSDWASLSSSTTRNAVLAGAADATQVLGVDVEMIPEKLFSGFDAYALHARETVEVPASAVWPRMQLWVLKEAVLKAAGLGLEHPPHELLLGDAGESSTIYWGAESHQGPWPLAWRPVIESRGADVAGLWCCLIPTGPGQTAAVAARTPQDIAALRR